MTTSFRQTGFLARKGAPFVPDPELDEKENRERETAYGSSLETFVIAFCTNAKKKRLFAFIDIIERLQQGEILNDDDPLFDQFNLKCPKCGRVYKDQERKICEYCSNNSAVFRRLGRLLCRLQGAYDHGDRLYAPDLRDIAHYADPQR